MKEQTSLPHLILLTFFLSFLFLDSLKLVLFTVLLTFQRLTKHNRFALFANELAVWIGFVLFMRLWFLRVRFPLGANDVPT